MINIKENTLERISDWKDESIYVLTDFDKTITDANSVNSWAILSKYNLLPQEYIEESNRDFNYYRPIELDETMEYNKKYKIINEWWTSHIGQLVKYKLSLETVNKAVSNPNIMSFRTGAKEFLNNMYKRNIPVIIISAGIGNFIENFLKINNCYYDNIYIYSNVIDFKDGYAIGIKDEVINSMNKNLVSLPDEIKNKIKNRNNIILLGDSLNDLKMIDEDKRVDALKIGFLEDNVEENKKYFINEFDIVCTDNASFDELNKKINILKK